MKGPYLQFQRVWAGLEFFFKLGQNIKTRPRGKTIMVLMEGLATRIAHVNKERPICTCYKFMAKAKACVHADANANTGCTGRTSGPSCSQAQQDNAIPWIRCPFLFEIILIFLIQIRVLYVGDIFILFWVGEWVLNKTIFWLTWQESKVGYTPLCPNPIDSLKRTVGHAFAYLQYLIIKSITTPWYRKSIFV